MAQIRVHLDGTNAPSPYACERCACPYKAVSSLTCSFHTPQQTWDPLFSTHLQSRLCCLFSTLVLSQSMLNTWNSSQPAKPLPLQLPTAVVQPCPAMPPTPVQRSPPDFDFYTSHQSGSRSVASSRELYRPSGRSLPSGHAIPPARPNAPTQSTFRQGKSSAFLAILVSFLPGPKVLSLAAPKHSRLPPKHVARKTPRKSITSAAQPTRPSPRVMLQKQSSPEPAQRSTSGSSISTLNTNDLKSTDDEDDTPLATMKPRTLTKADAKQPDTIDSMEIDEVGEVFEQAPQSPKLPPKSNDTTAVTKIACDTSHCSYHVPPELAGVKKALGENDWNEYVGLVRKVLVKEVAREKLDTFTRRTFQVTDARIYRKIEKTVAEMIVGSGLDLCSVGGRDDRDE